MASPLWFISGLREVASNINVSDNLLQVGRPVPDHVRRLTGPLPFPLETLFRVTADSVDYRNQDRRWDYDAECWGPAQACSSGVPDGARRQADVNRVAQELLKGRPAADVVTEIFGGMEQFDIALRKFISVGLYRYMSMKVNAAIDAKTFTARPLTFADEWRMRAGLSAATNRPDDVRAALAQVRGSDPSGAGGSEIEGQLFESEAKPADA